MTKIYHNPRCRKSRETLALLQEQGEKPEIIEYLTDPPTKKELIEILELLHLQPEALIRKGEDIFKEKYKGKSLTQEEWLQVMLDYPKLIERPIVVKHGKAVIGRPPQNVLSIL
jgi:arsenate reductase